MNRSHFTDLMHQVGSRNMRPDERTNLVMLRKGMPGIEPQTQRGHMDLRG